MARVEAGGYKPHIFHEKFDTGRQGKDYSRGGEKNKTPEGLIPQRQARQKPQFQNKKAHHSDHEFTCFNFGEDASELLPPSYFEEQERLRQELIRQDKLDHPEYYLQDKLDHPDDSSGPNQSRPK